MRLLKTFSLLIAISVTGTATAGVSQRMGASGDTEIFVTGEITEAARDSVIDVMSRSPGRGVVYFDTAGGDLVAGIELGRAIRKHGFVTDVGSARGRGIGPGQCLSVCTLSYGGGVYRYLQPGSKLGVHRFYRNGTTAGDLDLGQVMSSTISGYLDEMGIDNRLFDLMVRVDRNRMLILTLDQIQQYRLANYGFQPPVWKIEGAKGLVYLKGEQHTFNGVGKVLMTCAPGKQVKVSALYNAGQNNRWILDNARNYTIRINERFLPVHQMLQGPSLSGEFVVASFIPDAGLLAQIKTGTHVGFGFHGSQGDTFYGYLIDKRGQDDLIASWISHCQSL